MTSETYNIRNYYENYCMNSFRIKDLRFRILKGGKIGLTASLMFFGVFFNTSHTNTVVNDGSGARWG